MPSTIKTNARYKNIQIIDLNSQFTQVPNAPLQVFDVQAINNFIYNIIFTSPGEEPFEPLLGSGIAGSLFDNLTRKSSIEIIHQTYFDLKKWVTFVTVDRSASGVTRNLNEGTATFTIVYNIDGLPNQYAAVLTVPSN